MTPQTRHGRTWAARIQAWQAGRISPRARARRHRRAGLRLKAWQLRQRRPKPIGAVAVPLTLLTSGWRLPDRDIHRLLATRGGLSVQEMATRLRISRDSVQNAVLRMQRLCVVDFHGYEQLGQRRLRVWAARKAA